MNELCEIDTTKGQRRSKSLFAVDNESALLELTERHCLHYLSWITVDIKLKKSIGTGEMEEVN